MFFYYLILALARPSSGRAFQFSTEVLGDIKFRFTKFVVCYTMNKEKVCYINCAE